MKKVLALVLAAALWMSVSAQDQVAPDQSVQYQNALFVHPFSLIIGAASSVMPLMLNFTFEHALAPKAALIVTPNFFTWTLENTGDELSITSFGVGVGYRKYLGKPSSGIYLQAKADVGYAMASLDYINNSGLGSTADFTGLGASIIGYVGAKGQWDHICMFIDGGLGFGYMGMEADVEDADVSFDYGSTGVDFDLNFGLGYAF